MRSITLHRVETELDRAEKDFHHRYEMEHNTAQIYTRNPQERRC